VTRSRARAATWAALVAFLREWSKHERRALRREIGYGVRLVSTPTAIWVPCAGAGPAQRTGLGYRQG